MWGGVAIRASNFVCNLKELHFSRMDLSLLAAESIAGSLQIQTNINLLLMFPRISLHCKRIPLQYRETAKNRHSRIKNPPTLFSLSSSSRPSAQYSVKWL